MPFTRPPIGEALSLDALEGFLCTGRVTNAERRALLLQEVSDATLGLGAYAEVGPAGHFFGAADTLGRYTDAFYAPVLSDWSNFENWRDGGALTAEQRANKVWKKLLSEYEAPPIDQYLLADLGAFVSRRKGEIERGVGNG